MNFSELKSKLRNSAFGGLLLAGKTVLSGKQIRNEIRNELTERLGYAPTKSQLNCCFKDFIHFRIKYKGDLHTDYFGTQLYLKSDFFRSQSFATNVRFEWRNAINDKSLWKVFDDKSKLYPAFNEYLNREWIYVDKKTSWEEFDRFIDGREILFAKIPVSCGGKDVHLLSVSTQAKKEKIFRQCRKTPMILEEGIKQCKEIHCFSNYTAVNTMRIITIIDKSGEPHIAAAVFRIGRGGSAVDNYSSGGMSALIDVDTGIVYTQATNKKGKTYIIHPDSGKQIVGFVIPEWDRYKEFALKLAKKYPSMRYVGWDIVKDDRGRMCMIEGNKDAGADYVETGLLYGLLPHYNMLLNK